MAAAVALAFTSCDNKTAASKSDASDASKSEQVEEKAKVFEPTGDAAKDAKQCATEMIDLMKNVDVSNLKTAEDADKWEKEFSNKVDELQKKYEDFYKEKGEDKLKEFQKAVEDLENDPAIKKQLEDAQNQMMEKVMKLMSETKG
jgi:hypothetical protein